MQCQTSLLRTAGALLLALPLALGGCMTWRPVAGPLPAADTMYLEQLRIIDSSGGQRYARPGALLSAGVLRFEAGDRRVDSVRTGQIVRLAHRRVHAGRTVLAITAALGVFLGYELAKCCDLSNGRVSYVSQWSD